MPITRGDIPQLLTSGLRTEFQKGYETPMPDVYKQVCLEIDSTKDKEIHAWLGSTPKMTEWVSERKLKGMLEHTFEITNKDFEVTIEVERNALEDDQYGQIKLRANQLGLEARRFRDEYLVTIIEANGLCYDGQNFFDTDHVQGEESAQSNAPAASSTYAIEQASDFLAVLRLVSSAMAQFKDDKGKHYGARPTAVMVPTSLEWLAKEAFDPMFRGGGETSSTNWAKGAVSVIVNPFLTNNATAAYSAVYWLDLSKPIKPFIFQNRKEPEFVAFDKPDSYELFMRRRIMYGVDARFNMGFGEWKLAYKTVGSA